jgi:hypothetical protein
MAFVIGVAAQAQMGKDTLADRLQEKLNEKHDNKDRLWDRAAFAFNVKKVYADTFGVDQDFIEEWKVKLDEVPPGFDMPLRKGLQFIGDGFRKIRSTIWVDLCFRDSIPKIISDVRYINEFTRVNKEGGLNILIGRPDMLNDDPDGSEAMIKPFVEWALNNLPNKFNVMVKGDLDALDLETPPKDMELFDVFIRNDGTKEELYDIVDTQLVPFVESFVFDFPEKEEQPKEKECLISN